MKTRDLCAGLMMTGISLLAFSCSKQDQDEILNNPDVNRVSNNAPQPAGPDDPAPVSWTVVSTNVFSLQIPSDWKLSEMTGMDMQTGIVSGPSGSMNYEYGKRQQPYQLDPSKYTYYYDMVDGKRAKIISSPDGKQHGICIDSVKVMTDGSGNVTRVMGFMLMSTQGANTSRETAMTIVRSVRFK